MGHKNIHAALAAVMAEIDGYVQKKKSDKLNYTFASVDDIIAAVRPALVEHGVVVYPSGVRDLAVHRDTNDKGTLMTTVVATYQFTFAHGESETYVMAEVPSEGKDSGDKAHNKALTAAYKYVLKQTFMIETGDGAKQRRPPAVPSAPLEASVFKRKFLLAVGEKEDGMPVSTDQAKYLASLMTTAYRNVEGATDKSRIAVLAWLVDRPIESTSQLTAAECSKLLDRFAGPDKDLSSNGKAELLNLYNAALAPADDPQDDVWTNDGKTRFWEAMRNAGISANELFAAVGVKGTGEFFVTCDVPSKAYEWVNEVARNKAA